jgi:hypothetical protein
LRSEAERVRSKGEERIPRTEFLDAGQRGGTVGSSRNKVRGKEKKKERSRRGRAMQTPQKEAASR